MRTPQQQDFIMNVIQFFYSEPDVYARYAEFYWKSIREGLSENKSKLDQLVSFRNKLMEDVNHHKKNGAKHPQHFVDSTVAQITQTILHINTLTLTIK